MNKYKVELRGTKINKEIKAQTSLGAKVKFCKTYNLDYRVYANKLLVKLLK